MQSISFPFLFSSFQDHESRYFCVHSRTTGMVQCIDGIPTTTPPLSELFRFSRLFTKNTPYGSPRMISWLLFTWIGLTGLRHYWTLKIPCPPNTEKSSSNWFPIPYPISPRGGVVLRYHTRIVSNIHTHISL